MGQFLRIVIILIGVWLILRLIKRYLASRKIQPPRQPTPALMQACEVCGLHIPESEVIRDGNHVYCSEEHLKKAENQH